MRTLVKALPAHNISLQINHDGGESYPAHIYGYWAAHDLCTYMLTIQPCLDLEGEKLAAIGKKREEGPRSLEK